MPVRYALEAVLLIVCTAAVSAADQAAVTGSAVRVPVVAHLDVSVEDQAGQPITDLAVSDFEVMSDAGVLPIEGVTVVHQPAPVPVVRGRVAPADVPHDVVRNDDVAARTVVLVLDDVTMADAAGAAWMDTDGLPLARAFVERLGADDRGAVFFTYMGRQQGLTPERDRLRAAIDGFSRHAVGPGDCGAGAGDAREACLIDTLQRAADALPVADSRRKAIVVISARAGLPGAGGPDDPVRRRLVETLHAAHAVVYAIGPDGAAQQAGVATVPTIGDVTGGRILDRTTAAPADLVWRDVENYYLVALRSPGQAGDYQRVRVRVARPGSEVRVRDGYVAGGGGVTAASSDTAAAPTPIEAAIAAPHPATALPLGATAAVFAVPGRAEAVVSIAAAVTGAAEPGAEAWQADVATAAFDTRWRPRASHRQTIEVTAPAGSGVRTVDALSAIELPPGRYEIRVGVERGGRAGSVFLDVDVPEFQLAALSGSGVVVTTRPEPYVASPLLAQVLSVTPTTRRLFARGEPAEVLVRFYQGGRRAVRGLPVSLRIADASGEGVIQGDEVIPPAQFDAARSTEWRFALPLDRLAAGDYLLTVEAVLDDRTVTRHVRFAVMQ